MPFWSVRSTTLENSETYVNNTYKDANGNNKLTTISSTNTTGYVPIDPNSTDPIVKKTSYAVQNDGKITYQYDDGTGNKIRYNSIQEIANGGLGGYSAATTAKIKNSMQSNLSTSATTQKVGPSTAKTDPNSAPSGPITQEVQIKSGTDTGLPGAGKEYKYPKSLNARQDCIVFNMLEYSPRALSDTSATTGANNPLQLGKRSETRKSLGRVRLPIQGGIADGNAVGWGEDKMNALDLFKINVAKQTITGGFVEGGQTTQDAASKLAKDASMEKKSIAGAITQAVTGKNALARAEGAINNENMELLFQNVTLRTFNFTFKMSAREPAEAKEIVNIIRFFKQGMAAKRTKNEYFLKSPNTFEIKYLHDGKDHPGINKIKECALQMCNVNYTPDGFYSAHYDGYLVTYDVSMQFQELEPVYNDEYSEFTDSVGY